MAWDVPVGLSLTKGGALQSLRVQFNRQRSDTQNQYAFDRDVAGLAGLAGVVGGTALSIAPGEDVRYLLASLVVVIVGGIGSISGAAIGALLIGLAETFGLAYAPTYGVVFTFLLLVLALAFRPEGLRGAAR
jgi:hypothetical protein